MLAKLLNAGWKAGLMVGLVLGLVVALLWHAGAPEEFGIRDAVGFLSAAPPFTLDLVLEQTREAQYLILVLWWALAGAALGQLARGTPRDIAIGVLFAFTLVTAHRMTDDNINLEVHKRVKGIEKTLDIHF